MIIIQARTMNLNLMITFNNLLQNSRVSEDLIVQLRKFMKPW